MSFHRLVFAHRCLWFAPCKHFQPCLMFASKAGAGGAQLKHLWCTLGLPPDLNQNISPGLKDLPGTNSILKLQLQKGLQCWVQAVCRN